MTKSRDYTSLLYSFLPAPFRQIFGVVDTFGNVEGKKDFNDIMNSMKGKYTGANLTGAEMAANQFSADEAQKTRDWQEYMSNTTYQRTVQDMKQAGLNPALLLTGASGVSTPSGSTASSVSPSGASLTDLMSMVMLPLQLKKLKAETRDINAGAEGKEQENAYRPTLRALEIEGQQLSNNLTDAEVRETEEKINVAKKTIDKLISETKEADTRASLNLANQMLAEANASKIASLLPLEMEFLSAQNQNQKAQAAAAFASAAYTNGLINAGMIEYAAKEAGARASVADVQAALRDPTKESEAFKNDPKIIRYLVSGLVNMIDVVRPSFSFGKMVSKSDNKVTRDGVVSPDDMPHGYLGY